MLIDHAEILVKAGDGGNGKSSFRKNKKGPDGGHGGDGGDVYFVAKNDTKLLNQFSRETEFAAENGIPGDSNERTGRKGNELEIFLPVGTSVINKKTGREMFELLTEGERVLVARGGFGGRGNAEFKTAEDQAPRYAERGTKGEKLELILSLKLIADLGLIGLPNAGKSSLLNELTATKAKVANYPFTTLEPNLGVIEGKVIADIPGLIEGASEGRGLGIGFLKHIEKVKMLLHCVSMESKDIAADYTTVREELDKFNPGLSEKEEIVLLTKTDMFESKEVEASFKKLVKLGKEVIKVSIHDPESIANLKERLV